MMVKSHRTNDTIFNSRSVKSNKAVMTNEFLHQANLVAFVILLLASSKP